MILHLVVKTINGKVVDNFEFRSKGELIKKLSQGVLYNDDLNELLKYDFFEYHAGNCKVVFNYVRIEV